MVPLNTVFWGLVILFGLIGALRGWAKEIMVSSSVLLAMFIQQIAGQYILGPENPYLPILLKASETAPPGTYSETQFYICSALMLVLTFFGYIGPALATRVGANMARERLQEAVLGFFMGLINGYLIFGMLWFYLAKVGYQMAGIQPPPPDSSAMTIASTYLLPIWLTTPMLYIAIAVAFVFIIVVFV